MAWLTGYTYRKQITLTGTADGAQTNYQLLLNVIKGAGSDSGNTVYLGSAALNWPNDVRFTKSDGSTLLDFWREESDATDGTWWIEFDSIPASPNTVTFYIYYGKASDTDASNIANTFIFGDDAERGVNQDEVGNNWTESGQAEISTEQAWGGTRAVKMVGGAGPPQILRVLVASNNQAIRYRVYKETASVAATCNQGNGTNRIRLNIDSAENVEYYTGAAYVDTGTLVNADAWNLLEIRNISFAAGTYDAVINGVLENCLMWVNTGFDDQIVFTGTTTVGNDCWFDDIIVRNWTATEPTWTSWGDLELAPIIRMGTGEVSLTDLSSIWFGTGEVAVADIAELPVGVAV